MTGDHSNLFYGIEASAHVIERDLACHNIPVVLESLLLRSQMNAAAGDEQNSFSDVTRALELAEPEGFISVFVEEGMPIAERLASLLMGNLPETVRSDFVREILAAFPYVDSSAPEQDRQNTLKKPNPVHVTGFQTPLVEPLTNRELEVLRLISNGDSNQAIADQLVITVSAVKKHTSNIFGKLNVNNRTHAVARARQLGILPLDE
jgi:LuxR family maltose regulon positive regulatory protein